MYGKPIIINQNKYSQYPFMYINEKSNPNYRTKANSSTFEFFLLDSYENIKNKKATKFSKYPYFSKLIEVLCYKDQNLSKEMYYINDLSNSYKFIKLENQDQVEASIGILLPITKIKINSDIKNFVFINLKKSDLSDKMSSKLKINLLNDNFELTEINRSSQEVFNYKYSIKKKPPLQNRDNNCDDKIVNNNNIYNNYTPQGNNINNKNQFNNNNTSNIYYINGKKIINNNNEYHNVPNQNYVQNNRNNINSNINSNNNQQNSQINIKYIFPKKGLNNIGSTCYMNATLQCLLHVSELMAYFINEYPSDRNLLQKKNQLIETGGQISKAFYGLVNGVCDFNNINDISKINGKTNVIKHKRYNSELNNYTSYESDSISPHNFKSVIGLYNSQFKKFEANDSKDLILYLLQTMHEELNYYGDNNNKFNNHVNQFDRAMTFNVFMNNYNSHNFSIISTIFYGTLENTTKCDICNNTIYNFQKFEFISFGMYQYSGRTFNIYEGFKNNEKPQKLKGDNQFYCSVCKKLCDAEIVSKIIQPPNKLLINIDYGRNKKYKPSNIDFDEVIDITNFVNFNFGCPIKYRIICVCTHLGYSGSFGHYIAYCKHRKERVWYKFNDSTFKKCSGDEIYGGSPYLLLYE